MSANQQIIPSKDVFHQERSRFLDAFASLEEVLNRLPEPANCLEEKLRAFRQIRNDIVHSQLRFAQIEGQLQAIAINSQEAGRPARAARIIKLGDLDQIAVELRNISRTVAVG